MDTLELKIALQQEMIIQETNEFIIKVLRSDHENEILLSELLDKRQGAGLAIFYEALQNKAGEFKATGTEIPEKLIQFIRLLGQINSGLAGLTVYETYIYRNNSNRTL